MHSSIDTSMLDGVIIGRIDPYIYAFSTETIPNYLKVGDTYRPIETRLREWREYYPNLIPQYSHSAKLESGNIFRDYAVHDFLEIQKQLHRLSQEEIGEDVYYSREFFKDAKPSDIDEAIEDISNSEKNNDGKYHFYSPDRLPIQITYKRDATYPPRQNQDDAIKRFILARDKGRTNLLMYAVMRFGKSFTAMCCATEMKAKFVLVVSAKADVKKEWKKTVESHVRFDGYYFFDGDDLVRNNDLISESLKNKKRVVLFLTLQDLQGPAIKDKHEEVFSQKIDLLIVDESHFGARAAEYGRVLRDYNLTKAIQRAEIKDADTSDEIEEEIKHLDASIKLHLSGTPYRILMGDEFTKDDIIAFCQYTDIVDAKELWDVEHNGNDDYKEWDNPYYGFPQMIRFAFHPNESSIKKMRELRDNGVTYAFSALFKPVSLIKTNDGQHKRFTNEKEVLELFEVIDGSRSDENLLGFLDYEKIKDGSMCRHIVCVLPFRASCDALESLIKSNPDRFKNLNEYEIINIAGVDNERQYADTDTVKAKIKECESKNKKTITLTVNRMLTGSTVEQWDTMLYFKDTASPQEYDQAIFRIQNQYIKTYCDDDGNVIKYNMKPQTLLVDFDPDRMFRMQEMKSQFYNVNVDKNGNTKLKNRIARELVISPIITLNRNHLKMVEATDVMAVVQQYSQNKSIIDEATDIPYDYSLLDIDMFRSEIEKLNAIDSQKGLEIKPLDGDGDDDDFNIPDDDTPKDDKKDKNKEREDNNNEDDEESDDIGKKLAAYYSKILFYSFLTDDTVTSLEEVINSIAKGDLANRRIAKNLGLRVPTLWLIQTKGNPFILSKLDYKIKSINDLMRDDSLDPLQRAKNAMAKFARVSDSEVVTPPMLADELVNLLPCNEVCASNRFLDIASVQGEITGALFKRYGVAISNNIYSIPTSALTYELTRKVYKVMGLPEDHVLDFFSSDLLKENSSIYIERINELGFDVVIGVPPFGARIGGGRDDGRNATYQLYFNIARDSIRPRFISMMTQSTWFTGGRGDGLDTFREYMLSSEPGTRHIKEMHDYPNVEAYIKGVTTLRGGICLFLWDRDYDGDCLLINKINHIDYPMSRPLKYSHGDYEADFLIRWNKGLAILEKVLDKESGKRSSFLPDNGLMYRRNPFGFPNQADNFPSRKTKSRPIKVYLSHGQVGYAKRSDVKNNPDNIMNKWKVMIAKSSSGGDEIPHKVISSPIVAEPGSVTANTHYIISGVSNREEAENLASYMKTKFFRFMLNLLRSNQNMRVDMYRFVPRLDFRKEWTDKKLYKRYKLTEDDIKFINLIIRDFN